MRGKIVRGIAGSYYVRAGCGESGRTGSAVYECKARGIFRKENRKPLVGDDVEMDVLDEANRLGNIREILPSRSRLVRPAVANVDQALVIFSIVKPRPNFNLLDRFLIMMGQQDLPCIICFNKKDIDERDEGKEYERIYQGCGYRTICVSAAQGSCIDSLKGMLQGKTTAVAGPSGVGKSSIVNCLQSETVMETGQISARIERGRHTTRHTELLSAGDDTYILDTPGFSSLDLFDLEKEELARYYPEFAAHEKYCRFAGCSHVAEPVCGVREAVAEGKISAMRYGNYSLFYQELKDRKRF